MIMVFESIRTKVLEALNVKMNKEKTVKIPS